MKPLSPCSQCGCVALLIAKIGGWYCECTVCGANARFSSDKGEAMGFWEMEYQNQLVVGNKIIKNPYTTETLDGHNVYHRTT